MFNIITSYPKSGNTWLRFILFRMYFEELELTSKNMEIYIPDFHNVLSNNKITLYNGLKGKKIFLKTHLGFQQMEKLNISKIIIILRNPLDVLSSLINYYEIPDQEKNEVVNEFCSTHNYKKITRKFNFPSWSEHLYSWTFSKKEFLVINYNDLLSNFDITLLKISKFLNFEMTAKKIESIKKETSFNNLSKLEKYEKQNKMDGFFIKSVKDQKINFMNKGKKNNYLEVFNTEQIKKLEDAFGDLIYKYNL